MESRNPQPKVPSPTQSVASKGEQMPAPAAPKDAVAEVHEVVEEVKPSVAPHQTLEKIRVPKDADASEATHESASVKEPASQGSALFVDEEVQQKPTVSEAGKPAFLCFSSGKKFVLSYFSLILEGFFGQFSKLPNTM